MKNSALFLSLLIPMAAHSAFGPSITELVQEQVKTSNALAQCVGDINVTSTHDFDSKHGHYYHTYTYDPKDMQAGLTLKASQEAQNALQTKVTLTSLASGSLLGTITAAIMKITGHNKIDRKVVYSMIAAAIGLTFLQNKMLGKVPGFNQALEPQADIFANLSMDSFARCFLTSISGYLSCMFTKKALDQTIPEKK